MNRHPIGKIVDKHYKLLSLLGEGGYGTVYKAEQVDLARIVAIKFLRQTDAPSADIRKRFHQEAKLLAGLQHLNIVRLFSFGFSEDDCPYMVMEYLEGKNLGELLADNGRLAEPIVLKIAVQICRALEAAHRKGIIHRDLKPQNIMLLNEPDTYFVKILDFGLSKIIAPAGDKSTLTGSSVLVGTPEYMSPEAAAAGKIDQRADIYSLGCVLYQCVTGDSPFKADNPLSILYKHCNERPRAFSELRIEGISRELEYVIFKALQKSPADRYLTAGNLLTELEMISSGQAQNLSMSSMRVDSDKPKSDRSKRVAIIVICVSALIISQIYLVSNMLLKSHRAEHTVPSIARNRNHLLETGSNQSRLKRVMAETIVIDQARLPDMEARQRHKDLILPLNKIIDDETEKSKRPEILFTAYMDKGEIQLDRLDQFAEAADSFRTALKFSLTQAGGYTYQSALAFQGIARATFLQSDLKSAELAAKTMIQIEESAKTLSVPGMENVVPVLNMGLARGPAEAFEILAAIAMKRKNFDEAEKDVREALLYRNKISSTPFVMDNSLRKSSPRKSICKGDYLAAQVLLAEVYQQSGKKKEAEESEHNIGVEIAEAESISLPRAADLCLEAASWTGRTGLKNRSLKLMQKALQIAKTANYRVADIMELLKKQHTTGDAL